MMVLATLLTNSTKVSFLATKSVSALTSRTTPTLPSTMETTRPSAAMRLAFFSAAARPFSLRNSSAFSKSPFDSVRAFLQSIMPQPVCSRRFFTSAAVKLAIMIFLLIFIQNARVRRSGIDSYQNDYSAASSASSEGSSAASDSPCLPSRTALDIAPAISLTARMASSLPGMT